MAESAKHLYLVRCIVSYIRNHYTGLQALAVLDDLPETIGCDKPPKIGAFRPDVYAIDAPLTRTIIGEAKTQADLETKHARSQLRAFVDFLRLQENAVFILAVPWQAKARGKAILNSIVEEHDSSKIELIVIDEL